MLKFPPLKYKMPEEVIYSAKQTTKCGETYYHYKMQRLNDKHLSGDMLCKIEDRKSNLERFYPEDSCPEKSLYIADIKSYKRGEGIGTKLMKFAIIMSERFGCNKKVHLDACDLYDSAKPPYVFYRKSGFTSKEKYIINNLDMAIKSKHPFDYVFPSEISMYYDPMTKTP